MDETSIRLLAELFKESHVAIWACNRDFDVVLWNKGAEEIYGYTAEESVGRNFFEIFVDEAERDAAIEDTRKIIETGKRYKNLLAYDSNAADETKYMLTNCFRIVDPVTGEKFQAEIGVEISDLELRRDEHRTLRELGIARREARRYGIQRERDEAVVRVGRIRDEVRYLSNRTLRELEDFYNSASGRNKVHVRRVYEREKGKVTQEAKTADLELEVIELRCRSAQSVDDVRAALEHLGEDVRVWTDRVRSKEAE